MKILIHVTIALLILFGASCKKSKNTDPDPVLTDSALTIPYASYTKLSPGNYWIYEEYNMDSATDPGGATGIYDSAFVEKDTLIGYAWYHKYMSPVRSGSAISYIPSYLRDSLDYTVDNYGYIMFSSIDFTHVFRTVPYTNPIAGITDTINITYQMGFKDATVTVPAGTFKTSTFRKIYNLPAPKYMYGPQRDYDYCYAENIGLVKATTGLYIFTQAITERRLVRFHVR